MTQHPQNRPVPARFHGIKIMLASAAVAASAFLCACAKPPPPQEVKIGPIPLQSFARAWAIDTAGQLGPADRVYVRENYVFAYSKSGNAWVLDANDGRIIEVNKIRHGSQNLHPPVILKDRIVYPTNSSLEIYDRNARYIASKDIKYSIRSDAVGSGNYLYFGGDFMGGGRGVKVDITQPYVSSVWELMFSHATVQAAPALVGDVVYFAATNGEVTAVLTDNRSPVWQLPDGIFKTYGPVVADLVANEGSLYVASTDGQLVCLNRANGKIRWQYMGGEELRTAPAVTRDLVFQYAPGTGMVVLDKNQGDYNRKPRWAANDVTQFLAEDDHYVYAHRRDNAIIALDKATGNAAFISNRRDFVSLAVNTKSPMIYAVTEAGRVMAIKPVLTPGQVGEVVFVPVAPEPVAMAK